MTKERNFYYLKLRTIEDVLVQLKDIQELTDVDKFIMDTLYVSRKMTEG